MFTCLTHFVCGAAALLSAITVAQAQVSSPAPLASSLTTVPPAPVLETPAKPVATLTAPAPVAADPSMMLVQASTAPALPPAGPAGAPVAPGTTTTITTATTPDAAPLGDVGGVGVREFQGDEVGQVLRLLARQAKINMVVSDQIPPTSTVTMRLENVTALRAIEIIAQAKGLSFRPIGDVYYVKTPAEQEKEPTESASYQFSYARAKDTAPLIAAQLMSKDAPQVDERTNTMFYRETSTNMPIIKKLLAQIDKPTKQVMIEARLVEVNANPKQSYGINWAGVVGGSTAPQTLRYSGTNGLGDSTGQLIPNDFTAGNAANPNMIGNLAKLASNQFAILTVPQMSLTVRALNEDSDTEFLANPRIVTADNMQAKIEITRNQPVPQLNFNEQTATAVFGGFQDKKFGNTLIVKPSVNKDDFITLSVKPEISNKVGDATFNFAGATVASPVIDTRSLDSNVLIKSGDTLAIGGLLQDEQTKARTKVPVLGDIPVLGYLFQEKLNARTKRNLLVFVTPTILDQRYGTGLEDQVSGVHHSGEEFADPNGWRNNAKGAVRILPTSNRQLAADYPKPGAPPAPAKTGSGKVRFMADAKDRDN